MSAQLDRFVAIVKKLRSPGGCPWDREQTHRSLIPSLLDETHELIEAIEEGEDAHIREELGDLLLQVILHAEIARGEKRFDIEDVAREISEKIIRRHPHVFGDEKVSGSRDVIRRWDQIKRTEKGKEDRKYLVDGIPRHLPALFRAEKVQRRVARVGFDWSDMKDVLNKVEEEFGEFREAVGRKDHRNAEEELGDILFALVNVARHRGICAEQALLRTTRKFIRRFKYIEDRHRATGRKLEDSTLAEMDKLWEESKRLERRIGKVRRVGKV